MVRDFLLHKAAVYSAFQVLVGARQARKKFIEKIDLKPGDKILDVGCGPADVLDYLPEYIEYTGFDNSKNYIDSAKKQFKQRGKFFCEEVNADLLKKGIIEAYSFDIVLALGILHHLRDDQALSLFELAKTVLKNGGKIITLDGCYKENQSLIAKLILRMDRGKFVRTEQEYLYLANSHFMDVKTEISSNSLHIPYTLIVMKGTKN